MVHIVPKLCKIFGEPGGGPGDGTYVVEQAGNDFAAVSSGVSVVPGRTDFLVAHLQFRDGNDLATLFVNPAPGAAEPSGGVTYGGLDMPVLNPLVQLLGASDNTGVTSAFDEVRFGDTYAAVAPAAPEPACGALFLGAMALGLGRRDRRGERVRRRR